MNRIPVSVVIVSRGRANVLQRCLLGVSQLQYAPFEVIVVADPNGIAAARGMPFGAAVKLVRFDEPNISAARNLGIAQAAGEVVAFIDDDAVPEPQWLHYLIAPAERADVAAMGGYVRGRNGISYQWRARSLDELGEPHDLELDSQQATVLTPPKGRAIKTEGTNMAVRRDVLVALGGFDPAFHFFLDETDLNIRLARAGHVTAIVPMAEVHHGFVASATRTSRRVPTDLFDIGASWAVFQRKHVAKAEHARQWRRLRDEQRRRLVTHMVEGGLEPGDVARLMRRLDQGYDEGLERPFGATHFASHPAAPFLAFPGKRRKSVLLPTRPLRARKTRAEAEARVNDGEIVTMLNLSRTALYHRVTFEEQGFWLQKGGIFGRSERKEPLFAMTTWLHRVQKEHARVATPRGLRQE